MGREGPREVRQDELRAGLRGAEEQQLLEQVGRLSQTLGPAWIATVLNLLRQLTAAWALASASYLGSAVLVGPSWGRARLGRRDGVTPGCKSHARRSDVVLKK